MAGMPGSRGVWCVRSLQAWAVGAAAVQAVVAAAVLARPAAAQVALSTYEVHLQAAEVRRPATRVVTVRNDERTPVTLRVLTEDWVRDSTGQNVFSAVGSAKASCRDRISARPASLTLAPGASAPVTVTVAPGGEEGCWGIVVLTPGARPRPEGSRGPSLESRTGVKIYVHPARPVRALAINAVTLPDPPAPRPGTVGPPPRRTLAVLLENRGNEHLKLGTTIELRTAGGQLLATIRGEDAYLTPAAARVLRVPLPALSAGEYEAKVSVGYGEAAPAVRTARVRVR